MTLTVTAPVPPVGNENLVVRPVVPHDRARIVEIFDGLSAQSRYLRFLGPKPKLSDAEIRYFSNVDHHDHEAIVALVGDHGVGVARFVRMHADPCAADVAVEVVDAWQGRGLGAALLRCIARRARDERVLRLHATVLSSNRAVIATIDKLAAPWRTTSRDGPVIGIDVALGGPGPA